MDANTGFRWLGTAGIELIAKDQVLVIDPYFTRFSTWRMCLGQRSSAATLSW
jgi:L-ascorbate metabolism protein UlaG (beta-lactamase superfamily)